MSSENKINIFCHRGLYGCTDVNQPFLKMPYAKGETLGQLPPENSYTSIKAAFEEGYGVEMDVCMTKDNALIVTHTNHLMAHVKTACETDYVSTKMLRDLLEMQTGIGGKTESFLTYEQFLNLFQNYPDLQVNVEIKGTIEPVGALPPQTAPSIMEQLHKMTPSKLKERMIWSSFSTEVIADFQKLDPTAKVAQLFCGPQDGEPFIFKGRPDRYLQLTDSNVQSVFKRIPIEAIHVEIGTLCDNQVLAYCLDNHIHIRTWALLERNPEKDETALKNIQKVLLLKEKYPHLLIDIITDYAPIVKKIIYAA